MLWKGGCKWGERCHILGRSDSAQAVFAANRENVQVSLAWDPQSPPEEADARDVSVVMSDCPDSELRSIIIPRKRVITGQLLEELQSPTFVCAYRSPESPRPLAKTATLIRSAISETWLYYPAVVLGMLSHVKLERPVRSQRTHALCAQCGRA